MRHCGVHCRYVGASMSIGRSGQEVPSAHHGTALPAILGCERSCFGGPGRGLAVRPWNRVEGRSKQGAGSLEVIPCARCVSSQGSNGSEDLESGIGPHGRFAGGFMAQWPERGRAAVSL